MSVDYRQHEHHAFLDASREALTNANLQLALVNLGDTLGARNKQAYAALPESDLLRARARAIKDATLAEIDRHLQTLVDSVERRGGHVHFADDSEDACRIVTALLQSVNARKVVKSKSMTTEEIHLNRALESAGVEVVETDIVRRIWWLPRCTCVWRKRDKC